MKILYLNSLFSPFVGGGAEITLKLQMEEMRRRGHDVAVITTGPNMGLEFDEVDGLRVFRAGVKNLYWHHTKARPNTFVRSVWHFRDSYNGSMKIPLREVLMAEKPDVVSCHNLTGWSMSAWDEIRNAGIPIVQVLHDFYLLCARSTMFKKGSVCQKQCMDCSLLRSSHQMASKRVSAVVGVSGHILNAFLSRGYFEGVGSQIIYNARPISDLGERSCTVPGQEIRVGYIGTLAEHKGVDWLITEFQRIKSNSKLIIAGRGNADYEAHLRRVAGSSRVEFIGQVAPEDFYRNIDVCVVPSLWPEPLGMVAMEACAFHVPVIATRCGGLPEIVRDGVNGILCDPQDRASLGNAIETLTKNSKLLQTLSNHARSSVEKMLNVQLMGDQYDSIFRSVVEKTLDGIGQV